MITTNDTLTLHANGHVGTTMVTPQAINLGAGQPDVTGPAGGTYSDAQSRLSLDRGNVRGLDVSMAFESMFSNSRLTEAENLQFVALDGETTAPQAVDADPAIDWSFISELEGGRVTEGYVPDPEGSKSGVTIATGFDIGQQSRDGLETLLGSDNDLVDTLAPYTGLTKQDAVKKLEESPLTITDAEAQEVDQAVKSSALSLLETRYDNAVDEGAHQFAELPEAAQTVIASVAFQYGNLSSRAPTFWQHAVDQDWTAMAAELRDFGDNYPTRRGKEAQHLEDGT